MAPLIVILANGSKKESKRVSEEIKEYLLEKDYRVEVLLRDVEENAFTISDEAILLITLGGDGTVLYAARSVHELGIPILPVNLGTFGYITEVGINEWKETLDAFLRGDDILSRRLMLRVAVYRNGRKVFATHALNEAVITSSGIAKVVNLALMLDQTSVGTFRADGIIIATPTGSTGYSLAAGGPILDAEMSALIITPVCPFTLSNRPLVTSSGKTISVVVNEHQRTDLVLTVDGQQLFELEEKDEVIVEKSRNKMLLIHSIKRNFTEVIRDKLNWSGEKHA